MSYQLLCQCGRAMTGARQRTHQVVPCPGCGRPVFILPRSAFAPADEATSARPRRWWRGPLAAGAACFLLLLLSFVLVVPRLVPPRNEARQEPFDLKGKIERGRLQMRQGKFRLARETLAEAVARRDLEPAALSAAEHRELNQLHRQADLLSRVLGVELGEMVRQARHSRDPEEWSIQFGEDFSGKGVIFDSAARRDERGRPALRDYEIEAGDERVRLALEGLEALRDLPLDDEPRLVFGARLLGCERESGGGWVINFERDSGVLLTDFDAVAACWTVPPDEGLKRALARQLKWLDERAAVSPARP